VVLILPLESASHTKLEIIQQSDIKYSVDSCPDPTQTTMLLNLAAAHLHNKQSDLAAAALARVPAQLTEEQRQQCARLRAILASVQHDFSVCRGDVAAIPFFVVVEDVVAAVCLRSHASCSCSGG
jgi:outer membrane PBP1 activator LpoA protein